MLTKFTFNSFASRLQESIRSVKKFHANAVLRPLSEREATTTLKLEALLQWRASVIDRLGKLPSIDNRSCSELKLELQWLLEDVFVALRKDSSSQWVFQNPKSALLRYEVPREEECLLRMDVTELEALWKRRIEGSVPIQYLTETVYWRDLVLAVGPGVLIPRPETEQLVDFCFSRLELFPQLRELPWVDLGCGTGAIGLALAKKYPQIQILAVDKSSKCVECTQLNAQRLELTEYVRVLQGDWFEPLNPWKGKIGGIVSNPPYIPSKQVPHLQVEVADYEPHSALDGGGDDGIDCLKEIITQAGNYLVPGGFLGLETNGLDQCERLKTMLESDPSYCFEKVEIHKDYYGIRRFITAYKITIRVSS